MHRFVRNFISLVVILASVVAVRVHEKGTASEEVRSQLVSLCAGDEACLATVDQRFADCFDQAFDLGGGPRGTQVEPEGLAACLNERSSDRIFGVKN